MISDTCTTKRYYTMDGVTVGVRDSATGELTYLLGDQLGSTTVAVNASTGATSTQRFLPYGAPRSGSIGATDRGWIGQTKDASTGLQYLNARYYDPVIGRFAAVDPIVDTEQPGSLDRFGYGLDNPVTLSDPTGLWVPVGESRRSGSYDARRPARVDTSTTRATRLRLPGHSYRSARPLREPGPATAPKKPTVDTAPNPEPPDWEYTKDFHVFTTEGDVVDADTWAWTSDWFRRLKQNPNSFFPFTVDGGAIEVGADLCVRPAGRCDPVEVIDSTASSFIFRAKEGHVEGEGGEILFAINPTAGRGGVEWHLNVYAFGYGDGGVVRSFAASALWREMDRKLSASATAYYKEFVG